MAPQPTKYIQSDKKSKKVHQNPVRKTIKKKKNIRSAQQIENLTSDSSTQNLIQNQNIPKTKSIRSRNDISSSSRILRSASRQMNSQHKNENENCLSSKTKTAAKSISDLKVTSNNGTENLKLVVESKTNVVKVNKASKDTKLVRQFKFERNDICFAKMTGHVSWPSQILEIRDDSPRVWVYFFGDRRMGEVFKSQLYDFETFYKEEYRYDENKKQSAKSILRHKAVLEVLVLLEQK